MRSMLLRGASAAAVALLGTVCAAPVAHAQHTELRDPSTGPFARGDRLSYDVSMSAGWRVEEIRITTDPISLVGRLDLEVMEDAREPGAAIPTEPVPLVLFGRLEVRRASYAGPTGYWRLDPQSALLGKRLAALRERSAAVRRTVPAGLAARIAEVEEDLGFAVAAMGSRAFFAEVTSDGAVGVTPVVGDRLAPDMPAAAEAALRAYLAQTVRLVLPSVGRDAGSRGRPFQPGREGIRCDGLRMTGVGVENKARRGGPAFTAAAVATYDGAGGSRGVDLAPASPFTLAATLGASFVPSGQPAPDAPAPAYLATTYAAHGAGRATVTERHAFAVNRNLEVNEDVTATQRSGPRVRLTTRLRWSATLREVKLGKPAGAAPVEP